MGKPLNPMKKVCLYKDILNSPFCRKCVYRLKTSRRFCSMGILMNLTKKRCVSRKLNEVQMQSL